MNETTDADAVLLVSCQGAVAVVTLNRPEHLNAFDDSVHTAYTQLWAEVGADDRNVRAVVLTGAGRAFSAGGSIDDFDRYRVDFAARRRTMRLARRLVTEMLDVHVPVVAAVNGPTVGLGATLAALCDVVFISESTYIADTHVAAALVAGDGGALTWPMHMGLLKAKHYLLTGDRVRAAEAVQLGLANFAVPDADVLPDAIAYAQRLAALPPQAVQDTKELLNQHLRQAAVLILGQGLAAESQSHDTVEYAAVPEQFRARQAKR